MESLGSRALGSAARSEFRAAGLPRAASVPRKAARGRKAPFGRRNLWFPAVGRAGSGRGLPGEQRARGDGGGAGPEALAHYSGAGREIRVAALFHGL